MPEEEEQQVPGEVVASKEAEDAGSKEAAPSQDPPKVESNEPEASAVEAAPAPTAEPEGAEDTQVNEAGEGDAAAAAEEDRDETHMDENAEEEEVARPFTPLGRPAAQEEDDENAGSSEDLPITPEEVMEMADYLGIDVRTEYDLLWIAKQAVIAPLPKDWGQFMDESGHPYFFNQVTKKVARQHPSDRFFLDQIKVERQLKWQRLTALQAQGSTVGMGPDSNKSPWVDFVDPAGVTYYYNVLTNETAAELPEPGASGSMGIRAPQPGQHMEPVLTSKKKSKAAMLVTPEALAFKSWYHERGQKQYMDVMFRPETGEFHVVVQHGIAFDLPEVCGLGGRPLDEWDLYVGARLSLLGKPTILKQCDCTTGEWNEAHQRRLLAEREELEIHLRKFVVVPERPVKFKSGHKAKGSCNLRALIKENLGLRERLAQYDPTVLLQR